MFSRKEAVFAICLALIGGTLAGLLTFLIPPLYESKALVVVQRNLVEMPGLALETDKNRWAWVRDGYALKSILMEERSLTPLAQKNRGNIQIDFTGGDDFSFIISVRNKNPEECKAIAEELVARLRLLASKEVTRQYQKALERLDKKNPKYEEMKAITTLQESQEEERVHVITEPMLPTKPVWPCKSIWVLGGLLLGLALGFLWKKISFVSVFLFLILTELFTGFHIEFIFLILSFVSAVLSRKQNSLASSLFMGGLFLFCAPLVTAFAQGQETLLLKDGEYHSWGKALLIGGPMALVFSKEKKNLLYLISVIVFVCASVFLYRYKILGEVREFDLRPLLHTKNGDPNFMSMIFAFAFPLVCYLASKTRLFLFLIALLIYCIFLTESRMGLISLFVSGFYLLYQSRKKAPWLALSFLVILVFAASSGALNRFRSMGDTSNAERVKSYQNGIRLFIENPFLGAGMGRAPETFYEYTGFPSFQWDHTRLEVHNTPLQVLAELGVLGFLGFSFLVFIVLKNLYQNKGSDPFLFHASIASFLSLFLNAMTLPLQNKDFLIIMLFSLAVLNASRQEEDWKNPTLSETKKNFAEKIKRPALNG